MNELEYKEKIKNWIVSKNGQIKAEDLCFQTPVLEKKLISSLQVMELILFLNQLKGSSINMNNLKPGSFKNVDTIFESLIKEV